MLRLSLLLSLSIAACTSTSRDLERAQNVQTLEVPRFDGKDERTRTAGFVGLVRRENTEVDGNRFTLMAYAVGDTLTLGAMIKGEFAGRIEWQLDDRGWAFPLDTAQKGGPDVAMEAMWGQGATPRGERAGFRGYTWVNFNQPASGVRRVRLVFRRATGEPIVLPTDADAYEIRLVDVPVPK